MHHSQHPHHAASNGAAVLEGRFAVKMMAVYMRQILLMQVTNLFPFLPKIFLLKFAYISTSLYKH